MTDPPDPLSDAYWLKIQDGIVEELEQQLEQVSAERDRYRSALERIARSESGDWGWIAHLALREGNRRKVGPGGEG